MTPLLWLAQLWVHNLDYKDSLLCNTKGTKDPPPHICSWECGGTARCETGNQNTKEWIQSKKKKNNHQQTSDKIYPFTT